MAQKCDDYQPASNLPKFCRISHHCTINKPIVFGVQAIKCLPTDTFDSLRESICDDLQYAMQRDWEKRLSEMADEFQDDEEEIEE